MKGLKRELARTMAGILSAAMVVSSAGIVNAETTTQVTGDLDRVSVHDPSIVEDNGTYYAFGSHLATAKTTNMADWTAISTDYQTVEENPIYGNVKENLAESFKWAGYDDGDCANENFAVWAPDVVYNPNYENKDGSKGAYMLYYSASSTWRRSCIGYAVSKTIDGVYEYVDTIIYSGFTKTGETDGNSSRDTRWDNDYLNLNELIDKGSEKGGIDEISDKWFTEAGGWDNTYAPNAIDPTLFFNEDGSKMYMVYGSWSGGLFILEIDQATGEVIYPGVDSEDTVSGNFTDRYFGTHIAGGNHQSGEGPFIEYDSETEYYYLYETYGGLTSTGGYNMRLFRSKNPTGPYVDAAGNNAKDSGANNDNFGIKLIGNYQFYDQEGYCAAGHNSVILDSKGDRYLVFHQRFDDGTEAHEIRVHQQFINEDGWPVTAVYENRNEDIAHYADSAVVGSYEFVNHGTGSKGTFLDTQLVYLNEDGTVTGDVTGTWTKTAATDCDYVTITIGEVVYKGVFFEQTKDKESLGKAMTFTAIGNNNESIWGSQLELTDEVLVNRATSALDSKVPTATRENVTLPVSVGGAEIQWSSDNAAVLAADGTVNSQENDVTVTLTAKITVGAASEEKQYKVTVYAIPKVIYGYDFETEVTDGVVAATADSTKQGTAALVGSATVETDETRGKVLHITSAAGDKLVNYMKLPEDTLSTVTEAGYTVSMWVNVDASSWEHSALFEATADGTFPLTRMGVNLTSRINAGNYSDATPAASAIGERNTWQFVTYTVNPDGIKVYRNGELIANDAKDISLCFLDSTAANIRKANRVTVGSGPIWSDEDIRDAKFDNVAVYNAAMTEAEANTLYLVETGAAAPDTTPDDVPNVDPTPGPGNPSTDDVETPDRGDTDTTTAVDAANVTAVAIADQTYTGEAVKPALTLTYGQTTLVEGTDYTVAYSNNENVGTATATVTFQGTYTGTKTLNFNIVKATATITGTNTYNKNITSKNFTLNAKCALTTELTYKSSNTKVAKVSSAGKVTIKGIGQAVITVTVKGTDNYNGATKKITVNVGPGKITGVKAKLSNKKLTVSYRALKNVKGYEIQVSSDKNFNKDVKTYDTTKKSYQVKNVNASKTKYVRVRAYKKIGGSKVYGAYSAVKKVTK